MTTFEVTLQGAVETKVHAIIQLVMLRIVTGMDLLPVGLAVGYQTLRMLYRTWTRSSEMRKIEWQDYK